MKSIKLMADYNCFPLWEASSGEVGNINPESLPISINLRERLLKWAEFYDATLNMDNPMCSGFESDEIEANFNREGDELYESLKAELGSSFIVIKQ